MVREEVYEVEQLHWMFSFVEDLDLLQLAGEQRSQLVGEPRWNLWQSFYTDISHSPLSLVEQTTTASSTCSRGGEEAAKF